MEKQKNAVSEGEVAYTIGTKFESNPYGIKNIDTLGHLAYCWAKGWKLAQKARRTAQFRSWLNILKK